MHGWEELSSVIMRRLGSERWVILRCVYMKEISNVDKKKIDCDRWGKNRLVFVASMLGLAKSSQKLPFYIRTERLINSVNRLLVIFLRLVIFPTLCLAERYYIFLENCVYMIHKQSVVKRRYNLEDRCAVRRVAQSPLEIYI